MSQSNTQAPKKDGEAKAAANKDIKKKNENGKAPEEDLVSLIFFFSLYKSVFVLKHA